MDPQTNTKRLRKFKNPASLKDFFRNSGTTDLLDTAAPVAVWTDDFDDLVDNGVYILGSPYYTAVDGIANRLKVTRQERTYVNKGQPDELAQAIQTLFRHLSIQLNVRPELRQNSSSEEIDAVLTGQGSVVLGFHTTRLTAADLFTNYRLVVSWIVDAREGRPEVQFMRSQKVYLCQMAMYTSPDDVGKLTLIAKERGILLISPDGSNLSLDDGFQPTTVVV